MSVTLTRQDDIAILTLDRPRRRNALDWDSWVALRDHARSIDQGVRAVVVTGGPDHFCAGMDLSPENPLIARMVPALLEGNERRAREILDTLKECIQALADIPVPTFAAIEGACVGGGFEIALGCDVRITSRTATLGLPEVRIGMIPDLGGCARLTRLVGPGRAADLITTGRLVDGEEAHRLGLVERVCEPGAAFATAFAAAEAVRQNAPTAVALALSVVRVAPDLGLAEALALETRAGVMALVSGEAREGVAAFFEKRAPRWNG